MSETREIAGAKRKLAEQATELPNWARQLLDHIEQVERELADARDRISRHRCAPAPAASGGDGAPACELPASTVRDLFQLVGDADTGMRALAAAQAVILSYRITTQH